jgi:S1-C subfamily serine protease
MRRALASSGLSVISFFIGGFAAAQQGFVLPTLHPLSDGVPGAVPGILSTASPPVFANYLFEKRIFDTLIGAPEVERSTRGPNDIALFKNLSPSVVLISTPRGTGTGSIISDGIILTNYHVVDGIPIVGVLYKPDPASAKAGTSVVTGQVIKVDQIHPLAKPLCLPNQLACYLKEWKQV